MGGDLTASLHLLLPECQVATAKIKCTEETLTETKEDRSQRRR